jgi:hypothetical protein
MEFRYYSSASETRGKINALIDEKIRIHTLCGKHSANRAVSSDDFHVNKAVLDLNSGDTSEIMISGVEQSYMPVYMQ